MKKRKALDAYNRGHFGDESEDFLASLFLMARHPNGGLRPDLISINGRYSPMLSIEAKSGRSQRCGYMKGNMVSYQLHYAVTSEDDYRKLFGVDFSRESLLPNDLGFYSNPKSVAYYYDLIARSSGPTTGELCTRWDRIRSTFGNQIIIPSEIAFDSFVAHIHLRNRKPTESIVEELKLIIQEDVLHGNSHAEERKSDLQSRQNIQSRDMFAIFHEEYKNLSLEKVLGDSNERVRIISDLYGWDRLDSLRRIEIPGPNGTRIYVLAELEHTTLFDVQLRKTVEERIPVVEEVALKRKEAIGSLKKVKLICSRGIFGDDKRESQYYLDTSKLSKKEINKLEKLLNWCAPNEEPLSSRLAALHSDVTSYHSDDPVQGEEESEVLEPTAAGKGDIPF